MQNLAKQLLVLKVQVCDLQNRIDSAEKSGTPVGHLCMASAHLSGTIAGILYAASALLPAKEIEEFLALSDTAWSQLVAFRAQIEELLPPNPDYSSHAE